MAVKVNIREGDDLVETPSGFSHQRVFDVSGLTEIGPARLFAAMQQGEIPVRGQPHPTIPGIQVLEKQARPLSGSQVIRIRVLYGVPDEEEDVTSEDSAGRVEFGSSTISEQTIQDIRGERMLIRYSGTALSPGAILQTQVAQAEILRPRVRISVTRVQDQPLALDRAVEFTGKVNSTRWSGRAAKTFLCRSVNSQEVNRGVRFSVTYEFIYAPETWKFRPGIKIGGLLPDDAAIGNGIGDFDVFETADFNRLGFQVG